jgi:hypothetical protein
VWPALRLKKEIPFDQIITRTAHRVAIESVTQDLPDFVLAQIKAGRISLVIPTFLTGPEYVSGQYGSRW